MIPNQDFPDMTLVIGDAYVADVRGRDGGGGGRSSWEGG